MSRADRATGRMGSLNEITAESGEKETEEAGEWQNSCEGMLTEVLGRPAAGPPVGS